MARMLDALRRLEAANRLVAPSPSPVAPTVASPAPAPLAVEELPPAATLIVAVAAPTATALLDDVGSSLRQVEHDEPPFEPTFGPLISWERADEQYAYHSHAIDDALDTLDALASDAAESLAPASFLSTPIADVATAAPPAKVTTAVETDVTVSPLLDAFDPAQVVREHQDESREASTIIGLTDAPAVADDVMSTIQFAEHWATVALEEFGIDDVRVPLQIASTEDFSLSDALLAEAKPEPQVSAPQPIIEVAGEPTPPEKQPIAAPPKPKAPAKPSAAAGGETERPSPSPAELAAMLDLKDALLEDQYAQLAQKVLGELKSTTRPCAALLSVEHQPHVSDVTLRTAMMACRSGKQVLVIDGALGDKHLTNGLSMPVEFGLSEVLKGRVPWQQAVRATATPGLCVLPAGRLTPPRFAEDDHRLKDVLKELTSQWDLVLLDGGSLTESSALYVAVAARNVYLVVRLGETDAAAAEMAAATLASPDVALRGCIVTNAPT